MKNNLRLDDHFLAPATYTDINIICDSFIALLIYSIKNDLWFCPHYYSSDHCEQAFCYCRIARYLGRRTNISGSDILHGLSRRNRSVEITSYMQILQPQPIAHARSKSVMDLPKDSSFHNEKASAVGGLPDVVSIMNQATYFASYIVTQLDGVNAVTGMTQDELGPMERDLIIQEYKLDISKTRLEQKLKEKTGDNVTVDGMQMNIKTCMAIYANGGHTRLPSASRASRFFGYVYEDVCLSLECQSHETHKIYRIGDRYIGSDVNGRIAALNYKKTPKGLTYPATKLCSCYGCLRVAWVRYKDHGRYV